ncbi:MAG: DUF6786 family protein [Akkermansiaceae bacterium]
MIKHQLTTFTVSTTLLATAHAEKNFGEDAAFLIKHSDARVLSHGDARIIVVPQWQGRVMTSTAAGDAGDSYGWINYEAVEKGILPEEKRVGIDKHIHIFGGEERLWLGPEGGQHAIFFEPRQKDYSFANWKTPALIDTEAFDVTAVSESKMSLRKEGSVINNSGTTFQLQLERTVEVLSPADFAAKVGVEAPEGVKSIAFETTNTLTNRGKQAWNEQSGMLSIWMLGMLKHGPSTNVVIPLKPGEHRAVNTDYFGEVGADRLKVKDDLLFFKADGQFRSKIGIPPQRCRDYCGSYDPDRKTLTIVQFNLPANAASLPYVRSQWVQHEHPYQGDVIHSYNDGPPEPGADPLGPFYEIESSSPALPLKPGESMTHIQRTIHFQGDTAKLDIISRKLFGIPVAGITGGLE